MRLPLSFRTSNRKRSGDVQIQEYDLGDNGETAMRLSRNWAILALVSLLGTAGLVSDQRLYVCPGDQVARLVCCCPGHADAQQTPQPSLSSGCCCDITQAQATATVGEPARKAVGLERSRHLQALPVPVAAALPLSADWRPSKQAVVNGVIRPPPVPILLRKQSFLI